MLNLINKLYRKDKLTNDIVKALTARLTNTESRINDLYKQIFLSCATWYVSLKEDEMAITKKGSDLEARRNLVKLRLIGVGTATKEMLESTVNTISGVRIEIGFKAMTVLVKFLQADTNKYITLARETLKQLIPYHLDLFCDYKRAKWGEVKEFKWQKINTHTWGDICDSVEDTL